jgi:biopolymer transport protein ExbB/TolQ
MSITTIIILILAALSIVAGVVAYAFAQAAAGARRDADDYRKQCGEYAKQLTIMQAQVARRDHIIESIQGANHEAEQQRDKIEQAGPDPAGRLDAINSVLSDIARTGAGPDTPAGKA